MKTNNEESMVYFVKHVSAGWEVFDRAGRRLSAGPQAKSDAVIHAKELARRGVAQILIYGETGKLESEFFYQGAERPSLAHDDTVPSMAATQPIHRKTARPS